MSLLYPDKCHYCSKLIVNSKTGICDECASNLPIIKGDICERCGAELCDCNCKKGDFAFNSNISLMRFEGPAKSLVSRMKFGKIPQLTVFMGNEMSSLIKRKYQLCNFDAITYVPMNKLKQISRGFNQAELLALIIGEALNIPVVKTLNKKFSFSSQKARSRKDRFKKIKGAFIPISTFDYKNVLVIDDIITTGATLSECAYVLKKSGVQSVYCATFALTCKK